MFVFLMMSTEFIFKFILKASEVTKAVSPSQFWVCVRSPGHSRDSTWSPNISNPAVGMRVGAPQSIYQLNRGHSGKEAQPLLAGL